jgi:hypothetical protein
MYAVEKKALITSPRASALSLLAWSRMSSPPRCAQMERWWFCMIKGGPIFS